MKLNLQIQDALRQEKHSPLMSQYGGLLPRRYVAFAADAYVLYEQAKDDAHRVLDRTGPMQDAYVEVKK